MVKPWAAAAILLLSPVVADVVCSSWLTPRTLQMVDNTTGDLAYAGVQLGLSCFDVYNTPNGTVQNPYPIFMQMCQQGWYDAKNASCGDCLQPGCTKTQTLNGNVCQCSGQNPQWMPGSMVPYWGSWHTPLQEVCKAEDAGCLVSIPIQYALVVEVEALLLPVMKCDQVTWGRSSVPSFNLPLVLPSVDKDPLYELLRMMTSEGLETTEQVFNSWNLINSSGSLLFMTETSAQGNTNKIGPNITELQSYCKFMPNVFLDTIGTALADNQFINFGDIPIQTLTCVADDVRSINEAVANVSSELQALANLGVSCNNPGNGRWLSVPEPEAMTMDGGLRGMRRRLQQQQMPMPSPPPPMDGGIFYETPQTAAGPAYGPYDFFPGMSCNDQSALINLKTSALVNRAFIQSAKDAYNGCSGFLKQWGIYQKVQLPSTASKTCITPMYGDDGNYNPEWVNDPCCNWIKQYSMCCAPRNQSRVADVITGINMNSVSEYTAATQTGTLALEIMMSYAGLESSAATTCLAPYEQLLSATANTWSAVSTCYTTVMGSWSTDFGGNLGPKCVTDGDCYTGVGSCVVPTSKSQSGMSGQGTSSSSSSTQKYCQTPLQTASQDMVGPLIQCMMQNSPAAVGALFAYRRGLTGTPTGAQVGAALIQEPQTAQWQCWGQYQMWGMDKTSCLKSKSCNWQPWMMDTSYCANPCVGGSCPNYCQGPGGSVISQSSMCSLSTIPQAAYSNCSIVQQAAAQQQSMMCSQCYNNCSSTPLAASSCYSDCQNNVCGQVNTQAIYNACMNVECNKHCLDPSDKTTCAVAGQYGQCVFPKLSYGATDGEVNCDSECTADGGPNPKAPLQCIITLDRNIATSNSCNQLGMGNIQAQYDYSVRWDWSRGPMPPGWCVVSSYYERNGKPWVQAPVYGWDCRDSCVNELQSCLNPPTCWTYLPEQMQYKQQACESVAAKYQSDLWNCINLQLLSCTGTECAMVQWNCAASVGITSDPSFVEMNCASCGGSWMGWEAQNIKCAESLSDPFCRWNSANASQTCASGCLNSHCQTLMDECTNSGTVADCAASVTSLNQCRDCQLPACDWLCAYQTCDAFSSNQNAVSRCSSCPATQYGTTYKCYPGASCFSNASCFLEPSEYSSSCSRECSLAIDGCKQQTQKLCSDSKGPYSTRFFDACNNEYYQQYGQPFRDCVTNIMTAVGYSGDWHAARYNASLNCSSNLPDSFKECLKCDGDWWDNQLWLKQTGPACISGTVTFNGTQVPSSCMDTCQPVKCLPSQQDACTQKILMAVDCGPGLCNMTYKAAAAQEGCSDCLQAQCDYQCSYSSCSALGTSNGPLWPGKNCWGCTAKSTCWPGDQCYFDVDGSQNGKKAPIKCSNSTNSTNSSNSSNFSNSSNSSCTNSLTAEWAQCFPGQPGPARRLLDAAELSAILAAAAAEANQISKLVGHLTAFANPVRRSGSNHSWMASRAVFEHGLRAAQARVQDLRQRYAELGLPDELPELRMEVDFHLDASAKAARRLQSSVNQVDLTCTGTNCPEQKKLCDAFVAPRKGGAASALKVVKSHAFESAPWSNAIQMCQMVANQCYMSLDAADEIVLAAGVDGWTCSPGQTNCCQYNQCTDNTTQCADCMKDTLGPADRCDYCCQCVPTAVGYAAAKRLGGTGAQCRFAQNVLRLQKAQQLGKDPNDYQAGWTWAPNLNFNNQLFAGAGGCTEMPNTYWQWSQMWPQECNGNPMSWQLPQCSQPLPNSSFCLDPTRMKYFAKTRYFQKGQFETQATCKAPSCSPLSWITDQSICEAQSYCTGSCATCQNSQYWNYQATKTTLCQFTDAVTGNSLSESQCKSACGGSFTDTCYYSSSSAGSMELCITGPPSGSTCSKQTKSVNGTVPLVRYVELSCTSFSADDCGYAQTAFPVMSCQNTWTQCQTKADCLSNGGQCQYGYNPWLYQQSGGVCAVPLSIQSAQPDNFTGSNALCSSLMQQGYQVEWYSWGCIVMNHNGMNVNSDTCTAASGTWFPYGWTRNTCELKGFAWKSYAASTSNTSASATAARGTFMCCVRFWGADDSDPTQCGQWSLDDSAAKCQACGGTWISIFHFRVWGNWIQGNWTADNSWVPRKLSSQNSWVATVPQWTLEQIWGQAVAAVRASTAQNFISCRLNPTLSSIMSIATQTPTEPHLGSIDMLPRVSSSNSVGPVSLSISASSNTGNQSLSVALFASSTSGAIWSANSTDSSASRQLGEKRRMSSATTLTASCYSLVMYGKIVVGQLIGDCVQLQLSAPLTGPVTLCMQVDSSIPVNTAFTSYNFALQQQKGLNYSVFAAASLNSQQLCGSVQLAGTYCPALTFSDYSSRDVSADSSCGAVSAAQASIAVQASTLCKSGCSISGLALHGQTSSGGTGSSGNSLVLSSTGTVANLSTFAERANKTTAPAAAATATVLTGSLSMTVDDPAAFVQNADAKQGIANGLASALGVSASVISVNLTLTRRLSRELASGTVEVSYTITIPAGSGVSASSVLSTLSSAASDPTKLAALSATVAAAVASAVPGLTVTIAAMTPAVQKTVLVTPTAKTTTTTTTMTTTTTTTQALTTKTSAAAASVSERARLSLLLCIGLLVALGQR